MRQRILGLVGGRRRRTVLLGSVASLAVLAVLMISNAFAVHDLAFQLDGNIKSTDDTSLGDGEQTFDWADFFNSSGQPSPELPSANPAFAGWEASAFSPDFNKKADGSFSPDDTTTFTTGSKDTLAINPGWQCASSNNVNSKSDIMNAYALSYTAPNDDEILYFGLERNANTGTGNVAFWFLQDEVECDASEGTTTFTGDHTDGDLLIVSEFSQGGTVSTILVYQWVGGANGALDPNPVAGGTNRDCAVVTTNDSVCGKVNGGDLSGTSEIPWETANKQDGVGHSLRVSEFYEAGLNLTDEGLGGKCFNTFLANTRSSTSLTATIFDFTIGVLGQCTSTTTTTPKQGHPDSDPSDVEDITSESIPLTGTLDVFDEALIEVTGADEFDGTVTFFLCREDELTDIDPDPDLENLVCSEGGTQIGDPVAVDETTTTVNSEVAGLTAAEDYCWRAEFSGDADASVPGSEDASSGECFTVTPVQPSLSTQATTGPVDFGQAISDKILLSGTAQSPGTNGIGPGGTINATNRQAANGSIKVTAFGPDSCSTVALAEVSITVSGDKNDVDTNFYGGPGSVTEFTPAAPGQYVYVASYTGDPAASPINTLGVAATACNSQPSNEKVLVRQIPTEITTTQKVYPNDSATITSSVIGDNLPAGGSVQFRLFNSLANCQAGDNAQTVDQDGLLYKETVTLGAAAHSQEASTNNTSKAVSTNTTVYWLVTYTVPSGHTAHTGRVSDCAESTQTTFVNDSGPGSVFPPPSP
jgi:hypothetical protein